MEQYTTPAMMHVLPVGDRNVRQWLTAMGIKFGFNYLLMFTDGVPIAETPRPERARLSEQEMNKLLDDIHRQFFCHCGCYRHHGLDWMPEGSGEGKSVAADLLRKAGL